MSGFETTRYLHYKPHNQFKVQYVVLNETYAKQEQRHQNLCGISLANTRPLSIPAIDQAQQDSKNPSAAQEERDKKGTTTNIFI